MDPAAIIGIVLGFGAIFGAMIMEGGSPTALILIPPIVLVFGGTLGAAMGGSLMSDMKALPKLIMRAFQARPISAHDNVQVIVGLADRARREGLLALEGEIHTVEDPFLRRALEMAVDGTDADEVAEILGAEVDAKRAADAKGAKIFSDMGGYAPTVGIIGTVISLVHVLGSLDDTASLGPKIAGAFVATLWGVMSANMLWFPLSSRLKRVSEQECDVMDLAVEGVLAIQAGSNPRLIAQKLNSMLPQQEAAAEKEVA